MTESVFKPKKYSLIVRRSLAGVAIASGLTACLVGVIVIANSMRMSEIGAPNLKAMDILRAQIQKDPQNEELKQAYRDADWELRRAFFSRRSVSERGGYVILLAVLTCAGATLLLRQYERVAPQPGKFKDEDIDETRVLAQWSVIGAGVVLVVISLNIAWRTEPLILSEAAAAPPPEAIKPLDPSASAPTLSAPPSDERILANWPCFRGPFGLALSPSGQPPLTWNAETNDAIVWKTEIPKPGFSSPIVWDERVFLTGSDGQTHSTYCYDIETGNALWAADLKDIPGIPSQPPEVTEDTGHAAPTPACDGRIVVSVFSTGDIGAFDLDGKRLWSKNLGVPKNMYGHAASPMIDGDLIFIQYDDQTRGRLIALNAATGDTVWDIKRDVEVSWSTPVIARTAGRRVLLVNGLPLSAAYDPLTGSTIWEAKIMAGEVAVSPAYCDGVAYFCNEYATLAAIDVLTGDIRWEYPDDLPNVSTPLVIGSRLIMPTQNGMLTVIDIATGEPKYIKDDFEEGFYSSPVAAAGRVYLIDRNGQTHVFEPADEFRSLAVNPLGEKCDTIPAIYRDRILIRGQKTLYCIGAPR